MGVTIVELLWKVSRERLRSFRVPLGPLWRKRYRQVEESNSASIFAEGDSRQYIRLVQLLCCGRSAHMESGRAIPRRVPAWRARPDSVKHPPIAHST